MADWVDLGIENLSECKEVGSGGFATVYSAREHLFGRTVAVKVLYHVDDNGRRRFDQERLTMGMMDGHPNVITPHSAGYTNRGFPYVVMEYAPGGSLAGLLEDRVRVDWDEAVTYILPIADALGHGHSQGVLHRDIKPANILIGTKGVMKLADFGIASIREATASQATAYTLAHSPPETFAGGMDRRDERSDLYSLASSLFTLVRGRPPFDPGTDSDSFAAYLYRIEHHPVPVVDGPAVRNDFLRQALAKSPDERPRTANHFSELLKQTIGQGPARRPEQQTRPAPPPRRPLPRPNLDRTQHLPEVFDGKDWWDQ